MRADFEWEMTDDLVRAGNRVLLHRLLRGLTWRSTLIFWLISVVLLAVAVFLQADWLWLGLAVINSALFFLIFILTVVMPRLHAASLTTYLKQIAAWPHRRVALAITPDAIVLTSPVAQGLIELADLQEVIHDPQVTVLLFRGGSIVPVPTEIIPPGARQLLRFPGSETPVPKPS